MAPRTLLLRDALLVATLDDARREIAGGSVLVEDDAIVAVGPAQELPRTADVVLDCTGCVVTPGLVNTHHHMFQTLTRAVRAAQDESLFGWLSALYPIWARLTPEAIDVSTRVAMAELMLSGCSTTSDHLYLYPNGARLDDSILAAREMGMRFHACRGAMSVGRSAGGLPPDELVEDEEAILRDAERLVDAFHDPSPRAMLRVAIAPCSPFSVSRELMRDAALLARRRGVSLHTHLAEDDSDVAYSRERFGRTPAEYADELGWVGPDVWHAHCVKLDEPGIALFGRTGTGVAHCPCSNMRLGSGVAPIRAMRRAGVAVGLGVDGSASNDSGHLLGEARQAMLLQRVHGGAGALSAREAIEIATRGGARALGRDDVGAIAPGMAADVAAFDVTDVAFAGALHDPLAALVFCAPTRARHLVVGGRPRVEDGALVGVDLPALVERHNRIARALVEG